MKTTSVVLLGVSVAGFAGASYAPPQFRKAIYGASIIAGLFGAYYAYKEFTETGGVAGSIKDAILGKTPDPVSAPDVISAIPKPIDPAGNAIAVLHGSILTSGSVNVGATDDTFPVKVEWRYKGPADISVAATFKSNEYSLYDSASGTYTAPSVELPANGTPVIYTYQVPINSSGIAALGNIAVSLSLYANDVLKSAGVITLV